tara:strand:+ start:193 stop:378 length:186 start_codon:yes stop_codon:yes gene_type:complete
MALNSELELVGKLDFCFRRFKEKLRTAPWLEQCFEKDFTSYFGKPKFYQETKGFDRNFNKN